MSPSVFLFEGLQIEDQQCVSALHYLDTCILTYVVQAPSPGRLRDVGPTLHGSPTLQNLGTAQSPPKETLGVVPSAAALYARSYMPPRGNG